MSCYCGCGRDVSGTRANATNTVAGQIDRLVAMLDGASAVDGFAVADQAVVPDGQMLLTTLREVLHEERSRKDIDKRGIRTWVSRAHDAELDLTRQATALGYQGSATDMASLLFTGRRERGRIVGIDDTGTTVNRQLRAGIEIEAQPAVGESFRLSRKMMISRVAIPLVGDWVEVAFAAHDPNDFVFRTLGTSEISSAAPESAPPTSVGSERIEHLQALGELRDSGVLTDDEFQAEKQRLLGE
jgi:hypothetical protein